MALELMDIDVPGYHIHELVGEGGMAKVYRARHLRLQREVALKVLNPEYALSASFVKRFLREAQIAARLSHPNIAQIFDVNKIKNIVFISMELIQGGDLKQLYQPPVSDSFLLTVVRSICEALDFAHAQGYVHRDIKPANILFRNNGTAVLSDFGIAKSTTDSEDLTQVGTIVGTPSFMSPEQAKGEPLDGRADLYSLAVLIYLYLVGDHPFKAKSSYDYAFQHINAPIPELLGELKKYQRFFNKALAKHADDRYQDGMELVKALGHCGMAEQAIPDGAEATVVVTKKSARQPVQRKKAKGSPKEHLSDGNSEAIKVEQTVKILRPWVVFSAVLTLSIASLFFFVGGVFESSGEESPNFYDEKSTKLKIAQLISAAEIAVNQGRLIAPQGDNAYENYLSVLEISPNNQVAINGLDRVVDSIATAAEEYIFNRAFDKAEIEIERLRVISPRHPKLSYLEFSLNEEPFEDTVFDLEGGPNLELDQREILATSTVDLNTVDVSTEVVEARKNSVLESLIAKGDLALAEGRLIVPQENSAIYYFGEALSLDSSSSKANEGLNNTLDAIEGRAINLIAAGEFDSAQNVISKLSVLESDQGRFFRLQYHLNDARSQTE